MPTRIYDARLLDFQVAPCADTVNPLTGSLLWDKSSLQGALSGIMDPKTLKEIPARFRPVSLRWRTSPELGIPYSPFKVYRRKKATAFPSTPVNFTIAGDLNLFMTGPYWQITCTVKNNGFLSANYIVSALNMNQEAIPGTSDTHYLNPLEEVTISFKVPNINGILIESTGNRTITKLMGVKMEDFMNDSSWTLLETVGLPFKTGAVMPTVTAYQNTAQGYPNAPVSGYQAGVNRVALGKLFFQNPATNQPDGTVLPAWTVPQPVSLIDSYHIVKKTLDGTSTGVLYDIEEMLRMVQGLPGFYDARQSVYQKKYAIKGFSEDGVSDPNKNAQIRNAVCGTTLLGIATDCWNALGLGFGTTDLAPMSSYAAGYEYDYDYMVAATFRIAKYDVLWEAVTGTKKYDQFDTYEIAALAHPALPLSTVKNLGSEVFAENRPLKRDGNFSDDVKVFWDRPGLNVPTGYAIAVKEVATGLSKFLNADRPAMPGIKRPYIAAARADNNAQDLKGSDADHISRFIHHRSERSESVPATKNYYVATTDVFGRWTAFQKTVSVLERAPMVTADIINGKLTPDVPKNFDPSSPHIYPGVLELVVAWHWDDRTPFEINIGGHFQKFPAPPDKLNANAIGKTPLILLDKDGLTNINLSIGFNGNTPFVKKIVNGQSQPAGDWEATIADDPTNSAPPHTLSYKIKIKGLKLDFESASKLGFAAYLRSSVKLAPKDFTPFGNPKMMYTLDPIPRIPPSLPPDIQWGSLPDAMNISRYRVKFPPVQYVAGYAIYRATEADLREKLQLPRLTDSDDIFARRDQLFSLDGMDKAEARRIAKDAFIRISSDMIAKPLADVELPGDLNGIYIYAMTTFTEQQVESDFSNWLFVSVPRRYTPPSPTITAYTKKNGLKRDVMLRVEVPQGIRTETVDVFTTNKSYLAASIDLMGLPFTTGGLKKQPVNWKAFDKSGQQIIPVSPTSPVAYYEIFTIVDAGWQTLHYCAAGFGINDAVHGKLPGRSKSSNIISLQVAPPDNAPELDATLMPIDPLKWRMDILATVDIHKTPLGNFKFTMQKLNTASNLYEDQFMIDVPDIKKRAAGDLSATGAFYRLDKDAAGKYEFEYFAPAEPEAWYQVIVTDPLGRTDAVKLHYKKPVVILKNLDVKILATGVEVSVDINISNKAPDMGHYKLDFYTQGKQIKINLPVPKPLLAYSVFLDSLKTAIPNTSPSAYMHAPAYRATFFTYTGIFRNSGDIVTFSNSRVIVVVTDPDGKTTELTNGTGITVPISNTF